MSRTPFPLRSRRLTAGLAFGGMRSTRRGSGFDLAGSRPYRPGDDVRQIDHRASARLSSTRDSDEFIVHEHLTEEATRVVLVVDRRPAMALHPEAFPWLRKPAAIVEAGGMIVDSAVHARCLVGYLDDADARHARREKRAESPFWRPPNGRTEPWRVKERYLPYLGFHAHEDCLARALDHLVSLERALPPGTFVFLLSDFLVFPPDEVWTRVLAKRWDVVPVVIQDPTWEQSFPDVAGGILPIAEPGGGQARLVRLTAADVAVRGRENKARLAGILGRLEAMELDPVLLSREEPGAVLEAFLGWAAGRRSGARVLR